MGIFTSGKNKGAYQGKLTCPVCQSQAIRYVENLGPYMIRYRCRKCGLPFQYDIGPSANMSGEIGRPERHPYAHLKKVRYTVPIIGAGSTKKGD
jgi:transposase-like protein